MSELDSIERMEKLFGAIGMDPELYHPDLDIEGTLRHLEVEDEPQPEPVEESPKKVEEFPWQDALIRLTRLFKTERKSEENAVVKKQKKQWIWGDQSANKHEEETKQPESKKKKKRKKAKTEVKTQKKTVAQERRPLPPVDFCDMGWENFEQAGDVQTRSSKEQPRRDARGLFVTTSVRFAHNLISSWSGFDTFLEERFADPSKLEWLDLSYNRISEIAPVLSMIPGLKTLYLHCNCVDDLDEVRNLRFLPRLRSLTLYGNPIEALIDYRPKVIAAVPVIKRLDWSIVTPREAETAQRYIPMMKEREQKEEEERKQELLAAAAKQERLLKKLERKRRREQEAKGIVAESEKQIKEEQKEEEKEEMEFEEKHEEKEKPEDEFCEIIEEPQSEYEEEAEEELEAKMDEGVIEPVDLADPGPLDVKGKYKLHPDSIVTAPYVEESRRVPSEVSIFSIETVTVEDIREQFQALKEMEARLDQEYL